MPVVTADEVVLLTNISATAGTITSSGLIPIVQEKINFITNNFFTTEINNSGSMTFDATAKTIVSTNDFAVDGFAASDEIYINGSYRNDGYKSVLTVATTTMTLATTETVYNEISGANVIISLVKWPTSLKHVAAQMVAYDYDTRKNREQGLTSRTLGPFSETYEGSARNSSGGSGSAFGYPVAIMAQLEKFSILRAF